METAPGPERTAKPEGSEPSAHRRILDVFLAVRRRTEALCLPLQPDDYVVQSAPEVSPPKWHLGHTTWFFERFVLARLVDAYDPYHPVFEQIFNSYYESIGPRVPRESRGILSRPTLEDVLLYRNYVTERIREEFTTADRLIQERVAGALILGIEHEQQHQELLLTDIKHILWSNPLRPAFTSYLDSDSSEGPVTTARWIPYSGGIREIGYDGNSFCFDNETPRHKVMLRPFRLQSRLVTCGEYAEFIDARGYENPSHWLADGWETLRERNWKAPLYWQKVGGDWWIMTLSGMRLMRPEDPVAHVSFYEADAYARWRGARLPTEAEWETASSDTLMEGNFVESGRYHPAPAPGLKIRDAFPSQLWGDAWEWTASPYAPYPGFKPLAGALSEYNGKFMCNQFVLRGGSCATPRDHIRLTYRHYLKPDARWQFTGIRLAA